MECTGSPASTPAANPKKTQPSSRMVGLGRAGRRVDRPESPDGSGAGADSLDLVLFVVLATHLIEDDRVPARLAALDGDVVLPRPAAQPQLLDEIDFRPYTTRH